MRLTWPGIGTAVQDTGAALITKLLRDPSTEKSSVSVKKWLGNVAQVFKVALVKKNASTVRQLKHLKNG